MLPIEIKAYNPTQQNLAIFRALFVLPEVIADFPSLWQVPYSAVICSAATDTTTQDGWNRLKQGLSDIYMALGLY